MNSEPTSEPSSPPANAGAAARPFWSVMIPVYRPPETYLRQCLESVLQQDPGSDQMHIEVVDDCSPGVDVAVLVASIGGQRIKFSQTPKNLGLAGCWNTCIERARGGWVHILHQDDYVLPGFYTALAEAAARHPDACLLATRSFLVDGASIITGVTPRVTALENGGRQVEDFFYGNPIQCPGVVVRRDFYQSKGGFRTDLRFTLDCEMWVRAISQGGGVVLPQVLACYRTTQANESSRLWRGAENLRDMQRLNELLAAAHPQFSRHKSLTLLAYLAANQIQFFKQNGDREAQAANTAFWRQEIPFKYRWRGRIVRLGRTLLG